jgi:uncharacterized oxidoreductase
MQLSNNKILVTGGATGIGLGLTERILEEGNTVIICGRREDVLNAIAEKHPSVITFKCDLALEQERIKLFNWIKENHNDLNVLVNNAGIQNWMDIPNEDFYQRAKMEIDINILAPVHLAKLFLELPSLNTIMNVSSGLAFVPLSKTPVYSATKAFLRSFTLSLRHLLKNKNVEVIEIIPPALKTDLGAPGIHDAYPPVSDFITSIFEQLKAGSNELTFGFSEVRTKVNNETIQQPFAMLNPS